MTEMLERRAPVRLLPRAYWADDAQCRGKPSALFYGGEKTPFTGRAATAPGRASCASCPVERDCLLDSLLTQEFIGLRARLLGHERRRTLIEYHGDVAAVMAAYDARTL